MIDQMKTTDLYTGELGERFVIYVTGSDDSSTDTADEDSSTDTASESEAYRSLFRLHSLKWSTFKMSIYTSGKKKRKY